MRRTIPATIVAVSALAMMLFAEGDNLSANHLPEASSRWAIDADTTGNTATSLGTRDACIQAATGADVVLDVTIEDVPAIDDQGTPEIGDNTGGFIGFHLDLAYDGAALSVSAIDIDQLLLAMPGGSPFSFGDPLPDMDGEYEYDAADLGTTPGSTESGSGVVARLTLHVAANAAPGAYTLMLSSSDSAHVDLQGLSVPTSIVYSAQIAVDVPCPGPAMVGDVDCSAIVNAVDGLKVLRFGAGLSVAQTEPCNDVGTQSPGVGDVDCSGTTNAVDALKILRFGSGLGYTKIHACDDIGA